MERVAEPELMDEEEQARAYAEADFAAAHDGLINALLERLGPIRGSVLDLGCGPADPTVRFARANPEATITAVDAGPTMLRYARARIDEAGLGERITLEQRHLPDPHLEARRFDAVISNSLLHHLADPGALWRTVGACAAGAVGVMDLARPASLEEVDAMVERYSRDEPDVLKTDFRNSLCAAYTPAEVRAQLARSGLDHLRVDMISDRHLLVWRSATVGREVLGRLETAPQTFE